MNSFYLHFCHRLSLWWFLAKVSFISCVCTCDQPETAHLCIMDGLFQNTETKWERRKPKVWKPGQPTMGLWLLMLALQGVGGQDQVVFYIFSGRYLFNHNSDNLHIGKEPKKRFYLGKFSQVWVGGVDDSQTRSKPLKIIPKPRIFDPNFTFCVPKSHKKPGMGSKIWESFPK